MYKYYYTILMIGKKKRKDRRNKIGKIREKEYERN